MSRAKSKNDAEKKKKPKIKRKGNPLGPLLRLVLAEAVNKDAPDAKVMQIDWSSALKGKAIVQRPRGSTIKIQAVQEAVSAILASNKVFFVEEKKSVPAVAPQPPPPQPSPPQPSPPQPSPPQPSPPACVEVTASVGKKASELLAVIVQRIQYTQYFPSKPPSQPCQYWELIFLMGSAARDLLKKKEKEEKKTASASTAHAGPGAGKKKRRKKKGTTQEPQAPGVAPSGTIGVSPQDLAPTVKKTRRRKRRPRKKKEAEEKAAVPVIKEESETKQKPTNDKKPEILPTPPPTSKQAPPSEPAPQSEPAPPPSEPVPPPAEPESEPVPEPAPQPSPAPSSTEPAPPPSEVAPPPSSEPEPTPTEPTPAVSEPAPPSEPVPPSEPPAPSGPVPPSEPVPPPSSEAIPPSEPAPSIEPPPTSAPVKLTKKQKKQLKKAKNKKEAQKADKKGVQEKSIVFKDWTPGSTSVIQDTSQVIIDKIILPLLSNLSDEEKKQKSENLMEQLDPLLTMFQNQAYTKGFTASSAPSITKIKY